MATSARRSAITARRNESSDSNARSTAMCASMSARSPILRRGFGAPCGATQVGGSSAGPFHGWLRPWPGLAEGTTP